MDKFLSCDWGTSFFRLRLVDYQNLTVIATEKNEKGIARVFKSWKDAGGDIAKRQAFYQSVIKDAVQTLAEHTNLDLNTVPVIVSGMTASSIGMIDLPYKHLPVAVNGSNLEIKRLTAHDDTNELIIISGIRSIDDVIRGEETKIVGCSPYLEAESTGQLLVFPGTHPKHVTIKNKTVTSIKTYMTGEFFDLLTTQSVLSASVKADGDFSDSNHHINFKQGIEDSLVNNLLHAAFRVRTNDLLRGISKDDNFYYLSGLLIGTELKELLNYKSAIYLCGGTNLMCYYKSACDVLGIAVSAQIDADAALLSGQKRIYSWYIRENL
jgi:2-dehydro-3-deoxygalactonokinase